MTRIFISHSHSDEAIAKELVDYLRAALTVIDVDIRCTSVVGHKLAPGTHIENQLKEDIDGDIALIGLLTKNGLHSQWVLFELGAAWGKGKRVIPILGPGVKHKDLPGPLKSCIPVSIEDEEVKFSLNSMIQKLADELNGIEQELGNLNRAEMKRDDFINELKAWKSQPASDPSQQPEIEELTEKPKNKKELEQSLQSKIKQLEQQLEQARSQVAKQLQDKEQSHKQQAATQLTVLQEQINHLKSSGAMISFEFHADPSFDPVKGYEQILHPIQPDGKFHDVYRTVKQKPPGETWLWGFQYNTDRTLQAKFGKVDSNDSFVAPWISISNPIHVSDSTSTRETTAEGVNNQYDWLKATAKFIDE